MMNFRISEQKIKCFEVFQNVSLENINAFDVWVYPIKIKENATSQDHRNKM
jgi:hypothetical protein